jgi:hypothetical protein
MPAWVDSQGAAELLGLNPTTLASRLRALEITPPQPRRPAAPGPDR